VKSLQFLLTDKDGIRRRRQSEQRQRWRIQEMGVVVALSRSPPVDVPSTVSTKKKFRAQRTSLTVPQRQQAA
jgi:hypothetical protein